MSDNLSTVSIGDLIDTSLKLREYMEIEQQKFTDYLKPYNERREAISEELNRRMLEQKVNSFKADGIGTAYKSTRDTFRIADKTAFLDFVLEEWDTRGAMLQIGAPQVDAVRAYMDSNSGQLPPTVTANSVRQVHVKRSTS